MATADSVKTKINGLIDKANTTTGNADKDLTTAINSLVAGFGQGDSGDLEVDSLNELHYWQKYEPEGGRITETEVTEVTLSLYMVTSTTNPWDSVDYADEIKLVNGELQLVNPTTIILNNATMEQVVGKYIFASMDSTFYRIPSDAAMLYHTSSGAVTGGTIEASKAYKLTGVAGGELVGVVVSGDSTAYPQDGEQDGYRYMYGGTLGASAGQLPTLTNPGTATDMASGKELIDGNGNIVTGSLFELTSGNTLYGNNNPALSWRTDDKVETVGTYGVAGTGDGGIVRPGANFAIRVPAEQYGDATAADVTAGKTFTSSAGLKVVGTGTGGGGLVMKTGTTTSNVIDTGLSEIQMLVLHKSGVAAQGLVQLVYRKDTGKTVSSYCMSYSTAFSTLGVNEDYKGNANGGTFTWGGTGSAVLSENTEYNWIAVGTA